MYDCTRCCGKTDLIDPATLKPYCKDARCDPYTSLACPVGGGGGGAKRRNLLTVRGYGKVQVTPDRVRVTLSVEAHGETSGAVHAALSERAGAAVARLKESPRTLAVQTERIDLDAVYPPRDRHHKQDSDEELAPIGYRGRSTLSFECAVEHAGDLINTVFDEEVGGAQLVDAIDQLRFLCSDAVLAPAIEQALALAGRDAVRRAKLLLDALEYSLSSVVELQVEDDVAQQRAPEHAEMAYGQYRFAKSAARATPPVLAKQRSVESIVIAKVAYNT